MFNPVIKIVNLYDNMIILSYPFIYIKTIFKCWSEKYLYKISCSKSIQICSIVISEILDWLFLIFVMAMLATNHYPMKIVLQLSRDVWSWELISLIQLSCIGKGNLKLVLAKFETSWCNISILDYIATTLRGEGANL